MFVDIIAILAGFAILLWGAERFINGAAALARNMGVSPMLIGLTIVGFGTSAPEILVAGMAAWQGNPGLAIGNALGSNITNIALILGITALIIPLNVRSETLRREFPLLLAVSLLSMILMMDGSLDLIDGVILLVSLVALLYSLVRIAKRDKTALDPLESEYEAELPEVMSTAKATRHFLLGLVLLLVSSRMLVWGAVNIAHSLGISDLIIGLTIVALGTSLPELAAGIVSARKGEHDIAIGNVIGSNMYNLLAVLAVPALMAPGTFPPEALSRDMPVMIGLTLMLFVMGYGFGGRGRINRFEAAVLVAAFIGYQLVLFMSATAQQ